MCGIAAVIAATAALRSDDLEYRLQRRGKDSFRSLAISGRHFHVLLHAAVLHIQGELTAQPLTDQENNALLWNGEVFGGIDYAVGECDTVAVLRMLQTCLPNEQDGDVGAALVLAMQNIEGPFAFLYFHQRTSTLYFGRDPFGRRSCVVGRVEGQLIVSSVACECSPATCVWEEVDIRGVHSISLAKADLVLDLHPWPASRLRLRRQKDCTSLPCLPDASSLFLSLLLAAFRRRVSRLSSEWDNGSRCSAAVGVLFSGGIDSLLLAAALHHVLPANAAIDLINVVFTNEETGGGIDSQAPDRLAAIAGLLELKRVCSDRTWRLVHVDVSATERAAHESHLRCLLLPLDTHMDLNIGTAFWFASRGRGYVCDYDHAIAPRLYAASLKESGDRPLLRRGECDALRATGQRGGRCRPEGKVEAKCSVACCQRRAKEACSRSSCKRCCDRLFMEELLLSATCPGHSEGIGNNCPAHPTKRRHLQQMQSNLERRLHRDGLMAPCVAALTVETTEEADQEKSVEGVDDDIVETAAGEAPEEVIRTDYESACKVLVVGIGADEQLAGYARHRTAFLRGGEEALIEEMNLDLERLWRRNLGRDDRCISDHCREAWYPYLDEKLVAFVQSCPLETVADLRSGQGVGDKRILREAAKLLGLEHGAQLVKRAIQFGSLAAKQTSEQYFGSRRKGKGCSKV